MGQVDFILWGIALLAGIFATVGCTVMTLTPAEFRKARWCFGAAGIIFVVGIILWGSTTDVFKINRIFIIAVLSAIIIPLTVESIRWVNNREKVTVPQKPPVKDALFNAQLKGLQEIDGFICKKDENALRETFDISNIWKFNIKLVRRGLAPKLVTPKESNEIDKFFEGGQARLDLRYVKVDTNNPGRMQLIPGIIGLINTSKKYIESRRLLMQFYSSAELPVNVTNALKVFDKAIEDNSTLMIEVLNESLAENIENIISDDKELSPCFGNTSRLYWSRFIQLKPKADVVSASIRDYLEVK